jgi:hemoglobin-like flavoprotein
MSHGARQAAFEYSESETAERHRLSEMPLILERIAEHETQFTERFYEIFFERRPDTLPLFGLHAISEREEMMSETLRSLFAWTEAESWLAGNLDALGRSHWEYGVTPDMYDSYVDAMLGCVEETLGDFMNAERTHDLRAALQAVCSRMRIAGDEMQK